MEWNEKEMTKERVEGGGKWAATDYWKSAAACTLLSTKIHRPEIF